MAAITYILTFVVVVIIGAMGYYIYTRGNCPPMTFPDCPDCNCTFPDVDASLKTENDHLKMMVKYMSIIIRKNEAEKELYKWSQGTHRVFNSPKIEQFEKQILAIREKVNSDELLQKFFEDNLNMLL